ncbi:MAG: molybdopterin molybdenumtransferase MoeA [Dehalococcoidia bacterium]|nr:molybdopterin molybdenumtransferase MoeA [Dehalococcoidia bacterium]
MPELFNVLPPSQALEVLRKHVTPRPESEVVPADQALGRVLATDLTATEALPAFPRSNMDGYAVRAQDTFGAAESLPAYLSVVGEAPMGRAPTVQVAQGQAALCYTGGMVPEGADAVVMVEQTQEVRPDAIEVLRPVAPGENVVQPGEDIRPGDLLLPKGRRLRAQDIGGLMAMGVTQVAVARRPRVAIVSTGDEVVPPTARPGPGQVRDINSYTVAALVEQAGGAPLRFGIVPDDLATLLAAARKALAEADALVISAGSSVSTRDMTANVISRLGAPGVLVHGVSLRPGKPTVLAMCDGKPVVGLPGNPVSAMVVFDLFVTPLIGWLSGENASRTERTVVARLTRNIASAPGREDYVPVRLVRENGQVCAEPLFGKSNLIFTLVRADGLVKVALDKSGLYAGETVEVRVW